MNLYILRHGIATDPAPGIKDEDRQLTAKGKQRLWRTTEALQAMELTFDAVLTSPLPRALQTAQIVTEALELRKKLILTDNLSPDGSPKQLIEQIGKLPKVKEVLLVGHEPYLTSFMSLLMTGNTDAALELKKGGIAKLEVGKLKYGRCAMLGWLLTPRQLVEMA